ncbi:XRE family transcriptional regulator [Patulibacter sp. NPDC049589]|uniref:helix-turn-helix domain-containing protein n=1 Tax=Patulibacter sp. NPDC049589 TaxID=3154731 RepID=UPI0034137FAD
MSGDTRAAAALFSPGRLRQARQLKAITRAELARQANVSAAAISQYESGATRPKASTLQQLAWVLQVPVAFFTEPRTEPELPSVTESFFRSLRSTTQRERERAAAHAGLVTQLVAEIERHVELPEYRPTTGLELTPSDPVEQAEHAARAVRDAWGLGHDPIPDVVRQLERRGLVVVRLLFEGARVDAFSWTGGPRPLVVLGRDKGVYERSRFDAAHELAHTVLHTADPTPADAGMERQAHRFASAFLVPAEALRDEWPEGRVDWARLLQLKERWGMSVAALLYRGKDVGVLTPQAHQNAMKYLSRKWGRQREPGPDHPLEQPALLNKALGVLEDAGITLDDLVQSARLPDAATLRELLDLRARRSLVVE